MLAWDELYFAAQDPDPWAAMRAIKQINAIAKQWKEAVIKVRVL